MIFVWPFRPQKTRYTGSAQRALCGRAAHLEAYAILISDYAIHRNCSEETISGCEGAVVCLKSFTTSVTPTSVISAPSWRFGPNSRPALTPTFVPPSNPPPPPPARGLIAPLRSHPLNANIPNPQLATTEANRLPVNWEQFAHRYWVIFYYVLCNVSLCICIHEVCKGAWKENITAFIFSVDKSNYKYQLKNTWQWTWPGVKICWIFKPSFWPYLAFQEDVLLLKKKSWNASTENSNLLFSIKENVF